MGLDMYLKKGKKIPKFNKFEEYKDYIYDCGEFKEVVYWRKANQIHKWFVDNIQDGVDNCDYYEVSREKIEELFSICKEILEKSILEEGKIKNGMRLNKNGCWEEILENGKYIVNAELAEELLPTESGFFFGGTDYDEHYIKDLEHTVEEFEKILKDFDFENNYLVYTSSW